MSLPLTIKEYSEKAFVVRGDTKAHKEALMARSGRYNPNLRGGPGWIFNKRHLENITAYISEIPGQKEKEKDTSTGSSPSRKHKPIVSLKQYRNKLRKNIKKKVEQDVREEFVEQKPSILSQWRNEFSSSHHHPPPPPPPPSSFLSGAMNFPPPSSFLLPSLLSPSSAGFPEEEKKLKKLKKLKDAKDAKDAKDSKDSKDAVINAFYGTRARPSTRLSPSRKRKRVADLQSKQDVKQFEKKVQIFLNKEVEQELREEFEQEVREEFEEQKPSILAQWRNEFSVEKKLREEFEQELREEFEEQKPSILAQWRNEFSVEKKSAQRSRCFCTVKQLLVLFIFAMTCLLSFHLGIDRIKEYVLIGMRTVYFSVRKIEYSDIILGYFIYPLLQILTKMEAHFLYFI